MSTDPTPANRVLRGPAHAHNDGPCGDSCYEPTTADASAFLQAVTQAGTPATTAPPPALEEHVEIWEALRTLQDRLDHAEGALRQSDYAAAMSIRASAVAYAVPLVEGIAARYTLDGEATRAELLKTAVMVMTLLSPDVSTDEPEE